MTKEQAYEKLELPIGTDLQVVRQKFYEMHNDFRVQIDGSFSAEMRQRKVQQLEELKEAFALLNESTSVDDSASLPRTEKTFDHLGNETEASARLEEREEKTPDLPQALAIFGLHEEQDATIIAQTMQQHIAELLQQKDKSPLAEIKEAYDKAIAKAESARLVIDEWLYMRKAENRTAGEQSSDEQFVQANNTGDDTPTTAKKQPRIWIYILVGLLITAIGYVLFRPNADIAPVVADHPADTPEVSFPDVIDKHFVEVVSILRNHSLLIGDTTCVDDIAVDVVLEARLEGQPIRPGSMIPEQSYIDLTVTNGQGHDEIAVPDLRGLSYEEARFALSGLGLILGNIDFNGNPQNSPDAKVIDQSPQAGQSVSIGATINLTLSKENNKPKNVETLQVAPVDDTADELLNKLASEVSFVYNGSRLTSPAYSAMDEISRYMRDNPPQRYNFIIHFYERNLFSDEDYTDAELLKIAQDRGDALRQYLINSGVSGSAIHIVAKGNSVYKWRGDTPRFRLEIINRK